MRKLYQQLQTEIAEYNDIISKQEALLKTMTGKCIRLAQRTYIYKLKQEEKELVDQAEMMK